MAERTLGQRIKTFRGRKGWTQKKLSEESGVPQSRISELEGGKRWASAETLYHLAKALDITVEILLEGEQYDSLEPADTEQVPATHHVGSCDASGNKAS